MKTKALQLSSLAFALGLSAQAPPGPPVLEDLLPASSFASLRFGGLDAFVAAAQQLPAAGVIERFLTHVPADTRARFVDRWFDDAAQHVRQLLQRQGIAPSDVRELLGCPHVLGIGRPTITGMGPSVALLIETGNHHAAVERLAASELRSANAEIEMLLREALKARGITVEQSPRPRRG